VLIRHVLVTGASGFVGRVLCTMLQEQGTRVTALARRAAEGPWEAALQVDLAAHAPRATDLRGIDTVFHLAGHAHAEDRPGAGATHHATSVDGTRRLLEALPEQVQRVVFASSVKAMGEATPAGCLDETAPARPASPYGRARLEAEALVLARASCSHAAVVRLPLVYGAGVKGNLERMLRGVLRGRVPLVPENGNRRSLVSVADASRALLAAASTPAARGRVYLVTDGRHYSTRTLQDAMYRAAGRRPPPALPRWGWAVLARGGDLLRVLGASRVPLDSEALGKLLGHACYDASRARRELGYEPREHLEDCLPAMIEALGKPATVIAA